MPSFVISKTTHKILKNFAGISNSILLTEGSTQKSIQASKSVLAIAEFPEKWPLETGIFDLNRFLGALSSFAKPSVEFGENAFTISEGKTRIKYRYSDASTIQPSPKKVLRTDKPTIEFKFSGEDLSQLNKAAALLDLKTVTLTVEGGDVVFRAADVKNPASNQYEVTIPESDISGNVPNTAVSLDFKSEHLALLLEGNYVVSTGPWGPSNTYVYAYFKHQDEPISYFVVAQV